MSSPSDEKADACEAFILERWLDIVFALLEGKEAKFTMARIPDIIS
jgi:hypothetical protein